MLTGMKRAALVMTFLAAAAIVACAGGTVPAPEEPLGASGEQEDAGDAEHAHPPTPTEDAEAPSQTGGESGEAIAEVEVPIAGFEHISQGQSANYEHYPPSSGQHWAVPAEWGIYSDSLPAEVWVHNLEHSGIVVLYNCPEGCDDLVAQLTDWARGAPQSHWGYPKVIVAPDEMIESRLVALAWGWQLDLDAFDAAALTEFYNRHIDGGPEDVP